MKKELVAKRGDDMRKEYDLSKLAGGVRGKYYRRATAGTNLVLIEPDLVNMFPDSEAVNLRAFGQSRPNSERLQAPPLALSDELLQETRCLQQFLVGTGRSGDCSGDVRQGISSQGRPSHRP
jgi:hypothetical protein